MVQLSFTLQWLVVNLAIARCGAEYQTLNGYGNHKYSPMKGSLNTLQGAFEFHYVSPAYADGKQTPTELNGPTAREISLALFNTTFEYGTHGGNDLLPYFGQFICHDMAASPDGPELFEIPVETCDPYFDKACKGNVTLPFKRSDAITGESGYRVSKNMASTWIDASTVYGPNNEVLGMLREGHGGLLKVSKGPHGDLLPKNNDTTGMMAQNAYFFAGDFRANVNLPMVCIHTLLHLEHNHRARTLATRNPGWDDEKLFQEARRFVIALTQKLSFKDYAAAILGEPLTPYNGYRPDADPRVDTVFMTTAFRYGHSAVTPLVFRVSEDWLPDVGGHLPVGQTIFNPKEIYTNGMDSILRGLVTQPEGGVDISAPSDIRNHHILVDLVAFDIQRGRDRGVPSFNNIRRALGLRAYKTFADLTPNVEVQQALERVFGDIEKVDGYVGGLAERPLAIPNAVLPPTYSALLQRYFEQLRDADRFYYENPGILTAEELREVEQRSFADLVLDHTDITSITANLFAVQPLVDKATCSASGPCDGGNGGSGSEGSGEITDLDGVVLKWQVLGSDIEFTITAGGISGGYVGIGLGGSTMRDAKDFHIVVVPADSSSPFQVLDAHYEAAAVAQDENSCIDESSVTSTSEGDTFTVTFKRTLSSDDVQDYSITRDVPVSMLLAFSTSAFPSYHGFPNKASVGSRVLWTSGATSGNSTIIGGSPDASTKYISLVVHGASMTLIWMIFVPWGVFIVRYRKGKKNSMEAHQTFSQAGSVGVLAFAATAIAANGGLTFSTNHSFLGFIICIVLITQITSGWVVRLVLPKARSVQSLRKHKRIHKYVGFALVITALVNCRLGLTLIGVAEDSAFDVLYKIYIAFICFVVLWKECRKYLQQKFATMKPSQELKNVPAISHRQFVRMVDEGQMLMLINGYVYNVRAFVTRHPGGQHTIMEHLGVDATPAFETIHKHSVAALSHMNSELLQGRLEEDRGSVADPSVATCNCELSICKMHFQRFRVLTMYQIGGTKECPIMLVRIEINLDKPLYGAEEDALNTSSRKYLSSRNKSGVLPFRQNNIRKTGSQGASAQNKNNPRVAPQDPMYGDKELNMKKEPLRKPSVNATEPGTKHMTKHLRMQSVNSMDGIHEVDSRESVEMKDDIENKKKLVSHSSERNNTKDENHSESFSTMDSGRRSDEPYRITRASRTTSLRTSQVMQNMKNYIEKPFLNFMGSRTEMRPRRTKSFIESHLKEFESYSTQSFVFYGYLDGEAIIRNYSPVNYHFEERKGWVDFAIKVYPKGKMGQFISSLRPGRFIRMKGPAHKPLENVLTSDGSWKHLLLIAGGTGITAMMGVLRAHLPRKGTKMVTLLYQTSIKEDFILRNSLTALAQQYPGRLRVIFVCKQENKEGMRVGINASHFEHIHIPSHTMQTIDPEALARELCFVIRGPPGFVTYATELITGPLQYPVHLVNLHES